MAELNHEEPTRGKGVSRWLNESDSTEADVFSNEEGGGRFAGGSWRLLPTAQSTGVLRYENLGHDVPRARRRRSWLAKVGEAGNSKAPTRSRVTFRTLANDWKTDGAADVQALDAEEPSAHRGEAPDAAIRGDGGLRRHAAGDSSLRGAFEQSRIRARRRSITSTTCSARCFARR